MSVEATGELNQTLLIAGLGTIGVQLLGFLHGYTYQTEALFDAIGAVNSLALIGVCCIRGGGPTDARKITALSVFAASRLWLLVFLAWRAKDRKGDGRFDQWKSKFWAFLCVWMFQAVWIFCVAAPLLVINGMKLAFPMGPGDWVAMSIFIAGWLCEVVADIQKTLWVKRGRPGGFCTDGLWYLSRHPNYFGEILMWWAMWAFTAGVLRQAGSWYLPYFLTGLLSPVFTMTVLLFMSGLPLAEGQALARYQQFADFHKYRENTSILIPLPKIGCLPHWFKQIFLFEWPMYEYKPAPSAPGSSDEGEEEDDKIK